MFHVTALGFLPTKNCDSKGGQPSTRALTVWPRHITSHLDPKSLSEYMMTPEAEVALARSAAPENVSAHATVKVLTAFGYKDAVQGDNGFVCIVMRGWGPRRLRLRSSATSCTTRNSARQSASIPSPAGPYWYCRSCVPGSEWKARHRTRLPKESRPRTPKASCRDGDGGIRVHVLCRPKSWTRSWSVASSHDGVHPVLRELDAGR
jgi:hypothetical protein